MARVLVRLLRKDDGQDIVEYALLVAFVGLVVLAAALALQDAMGTFYSGVDSRDQSLAAVTPNP
jgi:Flp pilus assembly pilin Flp